MSKFSLQSKKSTLSSMGESLAKGTKLIAIINSVFTAKPESLGEVSSLFREILCKFNYKVNLDIT